MGGGIKVKTITVAVAGALALLGMVSAASAETEFCWRETWGTGVATGIPTDCPAGTERNGLLCYDKCKAGYASDGVAGCIQNCPEGAVNDGLFCGWPSYKVAEYPIWDEGKCRRNHATVGCGKIGLLWVENCRTGYRHVAGFCEKRDIDCQALGLSGNRIANSCAKTLYFREAKTAGCGSGYDQDAGLCYKACGGNADRVGPLCWGHCPAGWVNCGMGCAKDQSKCNKAVADQGVSVVDSAASIALMVGTMGASAAGKTMMSKAAWTSFKQIGKVQAKELLKNTLITAAVQLPANIAQISSDSVDFVWEMGSIEESSMTETEKAHAKARAALNSIALVDPSGVTGIVAAYSRPLCRDIVAAKPNPGNGGTLLVVEPSLKETAQAAVDLWTRKQKAAQASLDAVNASLAKETDAGRRATLVADQAKAAAELAEATSQLNSSRSFLQTL